MWRNALGGPARSRGPGAGGGGGPGASPPSPTPERGAPGRAPAGGGVRAGRGRGKRQLRFRRVGPRASSRCRRTGRCEAWKPLLEGRNRSDSVHSGRWVPGLWAGLGDSIGSVQGESVPTDSPWLLCGLLDSQRLIIIFFLEWGRGVDVEVHIYLDAAKKVFRLRGLRLAL